MKTRTAPKDQSAAGNRRAVFFLLQAGLERGTPFVSSLWPSLFIASGFSSGYGLRWRLPKNETSNPGPPFPRSCGRHRAE